jgi:excisionase family DNA binding protein
MATDLLTRKQAADILGVSKGTLDIWACHGRYKLPYLRVGRKAMYRRADLDAWLESRRVTHSGQLAPANS